MKINLVTRKNYAKLRSCYHKSVELFFVTTMRSDIEQTQDESQNNLQYYNDSHNSPNYMLSKSLDIPMESSNIDTEEDDSSIGAIEPKD